MLRNRRWLLVGALVAAQVGIVICYTGLLRGSSSPPATPELVAQDVKPADLTPAPAPAQPTPPPPSTEPAPSPVDPAPPATLGTEKVIPLPPDHVINAAPNTPDPGIDLAPRVGTVQPQLVAVNPPTAAPAPPTAAPPSSGPLPPPAGEPPAPVPEKSPAPVQTGPPPLAVGTPDKSPTPAPADPVPPPPAVAPGAGSAPAVPPSPPGASIPPPPAPEPKLAGPTPPPDVAPVSPTVPPPPAAPPEPPVSCPWTLRMEIIKGRTQIEARIGDEVQFRVNCVQIVLQAPRGSLDAQGDVKITGSDLDGTCEHLTINWQDDHVFLEGKAHLKCLRNGQDVELNSDRLSLKLSASSSVKGTGTTRSRTSSRRPVTQETEDDLK